MVRPVVVDISVDSVRDALSRTQEQRHLPLIKKDAVAATPVPYPIGSFTLQVTGVHMTLCEGPKNNKTLHQEHHRLKPLPDVIVVLLRAHVRGRLDAAERVFTVAALTLGIGDGSGKFLPPKGATGDTAGTVKEPHPTSAYAKLDLRVQMERIRFSVEVRPVETKRTGQKRPSASTVEEQKAGDLPVDRLLRITVMGTVSSLLLL